MLFEVKFTGMNYTTAPVHIIKTQQNLLCNLLTDVHGNTLVLMPFDQAKEVLSENFKDHANVGTIWAFVSEMVEE